MDAKKINELRNLILNSSKEEFSILLDFFIKSGWTNEEIEEAKKIFELKNLQLKTMDIHSNSKIDSIDILYKEELNNILLMLNNFELLKNINGLKILFYGDTGTGKTTLVKKIADLNKGIFFKEINMEEVLNYKFGQTQLNLIKLGNEINNEAKEKHVIIFLDELDSVITNRENINDVGEHARVVSTFIKFMDSFDFNVLLFASTNLIEKIDKSILRRFNYKIEGKKFSYEKFINFYNSEIKDNDLKLSKRKINNLLIDEEIIDNFTIFDLESFIKNLQIKKTLNNKKINVFIEFLIFFHNKLNFNINKLSEREQNKYKRNFKK